MFGCVVVAPTGETVEIRAEQNDLDYKFEVFPIKAQLVPTMDHAEEVRELLLTGPVEARLLQTQDWLDPGISCEGCLGQNPIAQCQGRPGEEPETSVATCRYFGGVELLGSNGVRLVVATLPFPYAIHVSAFPGTGGIDETAYLGVAASEA